MKVHFQKLINFIDNKDNYLISGFRVLSNLLFGVKIKEADYWPILGIERLSILLPPLPNHYPVGPSKKKKNHEQRCSSIHIHYNNLLFYNTTFEF